MLFGNKTAYPVYMTIGNLPKDVRWKPSRRGQILLAYLPTSRLEHITNKEARRRVAANLFHACLSMILKPLAEAGVHGIKVTSGDGVVGRVADFLLEQEVAVQGVEEDVGVLADGDVAADVADLGGLDGW